MARSVHPDIVAARATIREKLGSAFRLEIDRQYGAGGEMYYVMEGNAVKAGPYVTLHDLVLDVTTDFATYGGSC